MTQSLLPSASAWAARRLGGPCSAPLSNAELATLSEALVPSAFRLGQVVFESGQHPDGVWIIVQGLVELAVDVGGRHLVVAVVGPGDVFGDVAVFGGRGAYCTARALDPTTCLLLPKSALARLIAHHPAITRLWLEGLAARFASSQLRFLHMLAGPLVRRLAQVLVYEERDGLVRLPQTTLAGILGTPRPSVNRALQQLESARVIDRSYRLIRVIDPARLRSIARGDGECARTDV